MLGFLISKDVKSLVFCCNIDIDVKHCHNMIDVKMLSFYNKNISNIIVLQF